MNKVAPTLWTYVVLWMLTMFGIGMAIFGIAAIGAAVGVHIGGVRGAAATTTVWGRTVAGAISTHYSGRDESLDSAWGENTPGRYLQADLHYDPQLSWMTGGIPLHVHTGTAGRLEQFFPGPPDHFE